MILPIEKQVSSLEPSKRLKELGVRQESAFWWQIPNPVKVAGNVILRTENRGDDEYFTYVSAFTVAELGEMLPDETRSMKARKDYSKKYGRWIVKLDSPTHFYTQGADTEADARAKMLIYLIEKKLTPADGEGRP